MSMRHQRRIMHPAEFDARYSEGGRFRMYEGVHPPSGDTEVHIHDRMTDKHRMCLIRRHEDARYTMERMLHELKCDADLYRPPPEIKPCSILGDRVGSTGSTKRKKFDKLLLLT